MAKQNFDSQTISKPKLLKYLFVVNGKRQFLTKIINYLDNVLLLTLGVMSFSPVVSGSGLSEDEVVRPEDLTIGTGPDRVHGSGFEVDEDCPGDILSSGGFVVVDVDALQLQVGVSVVGAGGVDAVLVRDDFPEL
jgi:hypothetical protein